MAGTGQVKLCGGTCGRMTRNTKMLAKDYPGTVVRFNATHCHTCRREVKRADGTWTEPKKADMELKQKIAAERLELAEKARLTLLEQRAARARKRMITPVGLGQSMVRI